MTQQRFDPGKVLVTLDALTAMEESFLRHGDAAGSPSDQITLLLGQHVTGDWGNLPPERWASNNRALAVGHQVTSLWSIPGSDVEVYIVTVAGGFHTTVSTRAELDSARTAAETSLRSAMFVKDMADPERHS